MKYQYYVAAPNKVIAVSQYAGKRVKGYAKCDPQDEFDLEIGKKLAKLRCDEKIAEKRVKRAADKLVKATSALKDAEKHAEAMNNYFTESQEELNAIKKALQHARADLHATK